MNNLFLAAPAAGGGNMMMILMIIVLIAFTYFGMIRPQKKQQQKRMQMMDKLKKGDSVVLVDGLHGKIDSINDKDKTVVVDADGIYLTFSRMAVRQVIPAAATPATDEKADQAEEAKPAEPAKEADATEPAAGEPTEDQDEK
ncbi:preprotein translocase subunit YajC [Lactobacillus xujianguonis]|uniref:preprotein translocase subunit YajC n=1 Tax=Lactobacillus TaxID=1578 RepID=UPI00143CFE8D